MATEPVWVVILKIEEGSFETGFPCQLLVSPQDRPRETFTGRLPPSLELRDCYDRWKGLYDGLGQANLITLPPQTIVVSHFDECEQAAQALKRALNAWLNTESFRNIERQWLQTMPSRVRTLHFFVQTDEPCLKRLPWQVWDLLEQHYPDTEVMLSTEYQPSAVVLRSPLRILAVEGNTTGTIAKLNLGPLTTHPNLHIETLRQPAKKVFEDSLWDESWDILFFMGHSRSHEFEPNSAEKISVNDRHHALENAVKNGLKLAIFNSCDGVDIAAKLADLKIPYTIVMRHPIPDKMAELFLETFLKQFAQGKSIHESVHTARRRLKDKNSSFPCADWLPVIYQNPGAPDMRYVKPRERSPLLNRWLKFFLVACLTFVVVIGADNFLKQAEYDRRTSVGETIIWKPNDSKPLKKEAVQAFARGEYSNAIEKMDLYIKEDRLKDRKNRDPEAVIYRNNAKQRLSGKKTDRIAISVPLGRPDPTIALEMLQGIAQAQSLRMDGPAPIEVMIVDDDNKREGVEKVAPLLLADETIVGVIGSNAGDPSKRAAEIYHDHKNPLVMITPTAFSDEIPYVGEYVYRMTPKVETIIQPLSDYVVQHVQSGKVGICVDKESIDNDKLQETFRRFLAKSRVQVSKTECNISKGQDAAKIVEQFKNEGVKALLIAPYIINIDSAFAIADAVLKNSTIKLLGSTSLYTRQPIDGDHEGQMNGMVLPVPWMPKNDGSDPFSSSWHSNVTWRTAMSYDTFNVIWEALQKSDHTRKGLHDALKKTASFPPGETGGGQPIKFVAGDRQMSSEFVRLVEIQEITKGRYAFMPLKTTKSAATVNLGK